MPNYGFVLDALHLLCHSLHISRVLALVCPLSLVPTLSRGRVEDFSKKLRVQGEQQVFHTSA